MVFISELLNEKILLGYLIKIKLVDVLDTFAISFTIWDLRSDWPVEHCFDFYLVQEGSAHQDWCHPWEGGLKPERKLVLGTRQ